MQTDQSHRHVPYPTLVALGPIRANQGFGPQFPRRRAFYDRQRTRDAAQAGAVGTS